MLKSAYIAPLALATLLLAGFGCSPATIMGSALRGAMDGETANDTDGSVDDESVPVADVAVEVPTDFPSDVPLYSGTITAVGTDYTSAWASISTMDSVQTVAVWYMSELEYKGWVKSADYDESGMRTLLYTKDDESVGVAVVEGIGKTIISISKQKGY